MTPAHEQLLSEMQQCITDYGGYSYSAAYADILDSTKKRALGSINSVAATYIRTRSDRMCIFPSTGVVFEYDAKTNESGTDFYVECIPVIHHLVAFRTFGIHTVYGYRWPSLGAENDIGVIIDDAFSSIVDSVFVFDRDALTETTDFVVSTASLYFPNAEIHRSNARKGSGDPALRIRGTSLNYYTGWRELIERLRLGK